MNGKGAIVHAGLLALMVGCSACFTMRTSDSRTISKVTKSSQDTCFVITSHFEEQALRSIASGNNPEKPLLVFVHGAPGSSDAFLDYLKDSTLVANYRMIAIDRLGYGYSHYGHAYTSIDHHTHSLKPIIDSASMGQKVYLVGHSFGGPIVALYAALFPSAVEGIVMLAPAISPNDEKVIWFAHLGKLRPFRWLAPKPLQVATDEKFKHAAELGELEDQWQHVTCPVWHLHGDRDRIVPYENMDYVREKFRSTSVRFTTFEGENHFIPWTKEAEIKALLLQIVND